MLVPGGPIPDLSLLPIFAGGVLALAIFGGSLTLALRVDIGTSREEANQINRLRAATEHDTGE